MVGGWEKEESNIHHPLVHYWFILLRIASSTHTHTHTHSPHVHVCVTYPSSLFLILYEFDEWLPHPPFLYRIQQLLLFTPVQLRLRSASLLLHWGILLVLFLSHFSCPGTRVIWDLLAIRVDHRWPSVVCRRVDCWTTTVHTRHTHRMQFSIRICTLRQVSERVREKEKVKC